MSGSGSGEITVTLTTLSGRTESISVSPAISPSELKEFACALLGFDPNEGEVVLTRDGKELSQPLSDGDMVLVAKRGQVRRADAAARQRSPASAPRAPTAPAAAAAPGGLDFSNLLGGAPPSSAASSSGPARAPRPAGASASSSSAGGGAGGGNLSFNLPGLMGPPPVSQSSAVEWSGMSLDDAVRSNPNPDHFVQVLMDEEKHPNLMKELNYHSPNLARKMREARDRKDGARIWREEMMKGSIQSAYSATMSSRKESEMQTRLQSDPHDEEANAYFSEKIRRQNVDSQYRQMMEEYPESMGRVLMLYIDAEVNGHPIQAFVDSGAQSTIMSSACAERCGLLHLLDSRFEGTAVGVGTGKILGRVHIAPLKVRGHYFPCTITVMDSEKGLGDKNMDFLFGLDMLKRHRCKIDLGRNCLVFAMGQHSTMEAPFLHEKDLDENKGGTKGFDAERSNAELERKIREAEKKEEEGGTKKESKGDNGGKGGGGRKPRDDEESGYDGGIESEVMDVDETEGEHEGGGGGAEKKAKKRPNGGG